MRRRLETALESWRTAKERLPLLLFGARQVGKTHLLREFGHNKYENMAYVNLETNRAASSYFTDDISPETIVRFLEVETKTRIHPGKTLIVLDEIQSVPRALTSLKYFAEQAPEHHIAGVGSLLGVAVHRPSPDADGSSDLSFPVGNVWSLTLHPLDFEEFLWALDEEALADLIRQCFEHSSPLPEALHARAMNLYRQYLVVGGMPRVVNQFVTSGSLMTAGDIQRGIVADYTADMAKYATASEAVKIRAAYESLPVQLAKDNHKFQYKLVQRGGTAAIFGTAIDWLVFAGIASRCQRVEEGRLPLAAYRDLAAFKLYMGDTGLLTFASGVPVSSLVSETSDSSFLGAVAENYVAQCLTANGVPLHYWASDNRAEVDFVIQQAGGIVPIEVKAGQNTRSRSLSVFTGQFDVPYAMRISGKQFGFENNIKSVPLYAAHCIQAEGR